MTARAPGSPFADHFSSVAQGYAAFRPAQPAAVVAWAASLAPRRELAWDCGTGSGQAAVALASAFARVIATDASAAQLAHSEAHPRVTYRVARAEDSGLAAASVDLVTVAQALHWFDLERFYAEVRRVAAPGAAVAVWAYGDARVDDRAVDARFHALARETLAPDWPAETRLVDEGYRTIPFPFREVAAPAFTLEARWTLAQLLGYARSWSATPRHARRTGRDPVAEAEPELRRAWGAPDAARLVTWPIALRAGRVA